MHIIISFCCQIGKYFKRPFWMEAYLGGGLFEWRPFYLKALLVGGPFVLGPFWLEAHITSYRVKGPRSLKLNAERSQVPKTKFCKVNPWLFGTKGP